MRFIYSCVVVFMTLTFIPIMLMSIDDMRHDRFSHGLLGITLGVSPIVLYSIWKKYPNRLPFDNFPCIACLILLWSFVVVSHIVDSLIPFVPNAVA